MTQPTTRATLKDYAKRQLGHPVVELNLDDDQMEDRIDDALEFFQEYHFDATYPTFLKHQITASTLKLTGNVAFEDGETITGGTSGVRAKIKQYHSSNTTIRYFAPQVKSGGDGNTYYANTTTTFGNGETITGSTTSHSSAISAISSDTTTSWLSKNAINALLYGSLVEAYIFMKGEADVIQLYERRFMEEVSRLKDFGESRENNDAYRQGLPRRQRT